MELPALPEGYNGNSVLLVIMIGVLAWNTGWSMFSRRRELQTMEKLLAVLEKWDEKNIVLTFKTSPTRDKITSTLLRRGEKGNE